MTDNKDFKDTEIGRIPNEWEVGRLGDERIADLIMGQSPPSSTYNDKKLGLPFLQGNAEFGEMYPTPILTCSHPIKLSEKNDILLSVRAPVGDVNIAPYKLCIGRGLAAIRAKRDKLEYFFLFYYLKFGSRILESLSMGSTFKAIRKEEVEKFRLPLPPLPEQQKIAEILSTADEAIEKVEEAIEKTERLKKGLMHELLTKGIGHKDFKETEIGRIPKVWEVRLAEKVCEKVTDGTHDTPKPVEKGYPLITSKHIKNGQIDFSETYLISKKDFEAVNRRSKVDAYDVLFSMIGTVGETTIVKEKYPEFAIKNVGLFKTSNNKNLAVWLHYYFKSKFAETYLRNNLKGSTQKYIPLFALRNFIIVIPPPLEQQKISEILSTVDKKLELLRVKKERFERIKKGLMNDLLTGKKRVKLEA